MTDGPDSEQKGVREGRWEGHRGSRLSPLFIVGTGRCGTTLLQAMLAAHPDIGSAPETLFFNRFDPARHAEDPLPDASVEPYIDRVTRDEHFHQLGLDRGHFASAIRGGTRSTQDIFHWFISELVRDDDTASLFAEKTPGHQRYIGRINAALPHARFIHIHRDPRDTVASLKRAPFMTRGTTADYARYYRRVVERQARWRDRLGPERHFTLRYESLVRKPKPTLAELCSFLGIQPHPAMLAHHRHTDEQDPKLYLDFERSWKDLATRPISTARIGRYRELLSEREIAAVERSIGAPLLERLGYERDDRIERRRVWTAADTLTEGKLRLTRAARRAAGLNPRPD